MGLKRAGRWFLDQSEKFTPVPISVLIDIFCSRFFQIHLLNLLSNYIFWSCTNDCMTVSRFYSWRVPDSFEQTEKMNRG